MAREIPEVVRAAAGLAATVLDEARKLPETLPGLPVRVIGLAMQQAMKAQQQYAGFVARGDELFTGLRGANEPGLATFDDDDDLDAPASNGFRDSAFDRATAEPTSASTLTDAEVEELPEDPAADAAVAVLDELGDAVEDGQQSIEELVEVLPGTADILDEIAIDELVDQAPTLEETAPNEDDGELESALLSSDDLPATAVNTLDAEPTADVSTSVDVLTPSGDVATVDAVVTDEGVAAPEVTDADANASVATREQAGTRAAKKTAPAERAATKAAPPSVEPAASEDTAARDTATATDESGTPVAAEVGSDAGGSDTSAAGAGSQAAGAAPIDGYDSFSVAQLRGRLRGYALSTVQDLVAYEQATRAREPYLRMLRNRLEKLEEQAVESSPLAPRGA